MADALITWQGNETIDSYIVEYRLHSESTWTRYAEYQAGVTSATIEDLLPNRFYAFRVLSVCEGVTCGVITPYVVYDVSFECPIITVTPGATDISYSFPKQGDEIDKYVVYLLSADGLTVIDSHEITPSATDPIVGIFEGLGGGTGYKIQLVMFADWAGVEPHTCAAIGTSTTSPPAIVSYSFTDNSSSLEGNFLLKINGVIVRNLTATSSGTITDIVAGSLIEVVVNGFVDDPKSLEVLSTEVVETLIEQNANIVYSFTVLGGEIYDVYGIIEEDVYTACASFGLTLAGTTGAELSTLKAGLITAASGAVGEFVIDWYYNTLIGSPVFTSGSAGSTNPDISVEHPFTGEPVQGGTWYPVIRYIYIDGIKYTKLKTAGERWSPDLEGCLDPIMVQNFTCANGGIINHNGTVYDHVIIYTNGIIATALASRSVRFDLDAVNRYFAWKFDGYTVSDGLKIIYVSPLNDTETILENWKVGSDATPYSILINPKNQQRGWMAKITPLTGIPHSAGDYLRIEVTPSANNNTNWMMHFGCLDVVDCEVPDYNQRNIDLNSITVTWNAAACRWELTYAKPAYDKGISDFIYGYHYNSGYLSSNLIGARLNDVISGVFINRTVNTSTQSVLPGSYTACEAMVGSANFFRSGNDIIITFTDQSDYNALKQSYLSAASTPAMSNYDPDPTKLNHYKWWYMSVRFGASCGDTQTQKYIITNYEYPPQFIDGSKQAIFTYNTKTNQYVPLNSCDIQSVNTINSYTTQAIGGGQFAEGFNQSTNIRSGINKITGYSLSQTASTPMSATANYSERIVDVDICDLSLDGWSDDGLPANEYTLFTSYDRFTILNEADPANNYRFERLVDPITGEILAAADYIIMKEVVNGVITILNGESL